MKLPWIFVCLVLFPFCAWGLEATDPASIQVQGEAVLQVPADQVRLRVGIVSEASEAGAAMQANSQAMHRVEQALLGAGLKKGEYSTGQFILQPRWSNRPRNAPSDWRPTIVGYQVRNSLVIRTAHMGLAGKLIAAAHEAGANEIGEISFGLADPRRYRGKAIAEAVANARADAANAAAAAGMRLGAVRKISLGPQGTPPVRSMAQRGMLRTMAAESAPPIVAPADLQVRASVSLEFWLQPVGKKRR